MGTLILDEAAPSTNAQSPATEAPGGALLVLTVTDLARELCLSPATIRRLHSRGILPPAIRIGRNLRWVRSQICEYLANATASAIVTPKRKGTRPPKYLAGQKTLWDGGDHDEADSPPPSPPKKEAADDALAQVECTCPRDRWVTVGSDARGMGRITCGSCGRFVGYQRPAEQSPTLPDHHDCDAGCPLFQGAESAT